jgi:tetratricopeptide (TPR) repeat protein
LEVEPLFLRGKEAADRGNYDYAITIFLDVLRTEPTHRSSRIALRGCEMEKFREQGGGVKARLLGMLHGIGPLLKIPFTREPKKVIDLCEQYLVGDPANLGILTRLAKAYTKLGHMEAAIDTLEFARQRAPRNVKVLRNLGTLLYQQGIYDKAVRCFQEISSIKPQDREADDKVREISAESHLKRSHMEQSQTFREQLRDESAATNLEKEQRIAVTSDERTAEADKLKAEALAHPEDAEGFVRWGDALFRAEHFSEAEGIYRKAFEISKKWPVREKMGNSRLRALEQIERAAAKKVEENSQDPQSLGAKSEARRKRLEFAIKEFDFRRKQHPTDMKLALQLGIYYIEAGGAANIQNAIPQFQQAMTSPGLKVRAQHLLGRCFTNDPKTLDMAREQFASALESLDDANTDAAKALMFDLALTSEKLGDKVEAIKWYKKIFSVDASYRNVAKKIQELG